MTSLFTRGGESDFTLVLVDGVRANAFGGGLDLSQVPLQDVDRIEVLRGPQSALYGSDAIGGVVSDHHAQRRPAVGAGAGRNRQPRHAARRGRDDRRGQRLALAGRRQLFRGRRLHRHGRERRDRVERRCAGDAGVGIDRLAARGERHRTCRASLQYVDTERGSPGAVRIGSGASLLRRRHGVARHDQARRRRRALDAAVVRRRQPRPPARRVRRRRLRPELQEPVRHVGGQHASRARARADRRRRPTPRSDSPAASSGSASAAAAPSSPPARPARFPSSAACSASSARRAGTPPIARPSPPACAASASRAMRCPAIRSPSSRGRTFPEETINSVNPKIAASFAIARRHAPARLVRHRHPSARCVRDRLHRQLGPEARAQQERRGRRDADARRRRGADRRARRSSTTTPT